MAHFRIGELRHFSLASYELFSYFIIMGIQSDTKTIKNWKVDLENLTCQNIENHMIIAFEKKGMALEGKIRDMPIGLLEKWAREPNGERHIKIAVIEADEAFFRAYFNREIEKKRIAEALLAVPA